MQQYWQARAKAELELRRRRNSDADQVMGFNWQPNKGKQEQAFRCDAFEVLYGGSAGAGKSDLLLGVARKKHRRSLLVRRTYNQLEETLILRSREIYGSQDWYNASKYVWTFPDGCRIRFGHMENEKSAYNYQGAQYDFIGFDELTQFTKFQYEYVISRLRTVMDGVRTQVLSCTNPGGEGNDWVMERWAPWLDDTYYLPAKSGEVRYFKRLSDGKEVETEADDPDGMSRTFISARLDDNPYLGEDYRRTLNLMPEPYRSQLLYGDWQAGQMDDAYQVIPRDWVKQAFQRWRERPRPQMELSSLGVDVSRGGSDKTVFAERYGNWFAPLRKFPGSIVRDGQSVLALLADIKGVNESPIMIDVIGIGASAYDLAKERYRAVPINWAEGSERTDRSGKFPFVNKRAEQWWRLREALDPDNGEDICLPEDPELLGDLCAARYVIQSNGIKIESKEDVKHRIGRSPDCGDAVVMAFSSEESNEQLPFVFQAVRYYDDEFSHIP